MLTEGMQAPEFTLADKEGKLVSLSDFLGKKVVLYFYPKDNTPGCTRQACAFATAYSEFERKNAVVIGIIAFLLSCCPIPNCRRSRHTVSGRKRNCMERQVWALSARPFSLTNREARQNSLRCAVLVGKRLFNPED